MFKTNILTALPNTIISLIIGGIIGYLIQDNYYKREKLETLATHTNEIHYMLIELNHDIDNIFKIATSDDYITLVNDRDIPNTFDLVMSIFKLATLKVPNSTKQVQYFSNTSLSFLSKAILITQQKFLQESTDNEELTLSYIEAKENIAALQHKLLDISNNNNVSDDNIYICDYINDELHCLTSDL